MRDVWLYPTESRRTFWINNLMKKLIVKNKRAYFDYEIIESAEAWIELKWHEVKSVRAGQVNLKWSYIVSHGQELFIKWAHISPWKALPNTSIIETDRERKVFLPKKKILSYQTKIQQWGVSLVPLEMYFKGSLIKVSIWLVRGKKLHQKKQTLKERTLDREAKMMLKKNY